MGVRGVLSQAPLEAGAIAPPANGLFPDIDADSGHGNGHSNTSKGVANESHGVKTSVVKGKMSYGGEGGIRTPGRGFSPYNGLANSRFHRLMFGINSLRSDEMPYFGAIHSCLGAFVQPLCNDFRSKTATVLPTVKTAISPTLEERLLVHLFRSRGSPLYSLYRFGSAPRCFVELTLGSLPTLHPTGPCY